MFKVQYNTIYLLICYRSDVVRIELCRMNEWFLMTSQVVVFEQQDK